MVKILSDIFHLIKIILAAIQLVWQNNLLTSSDNQPLENITVVVSTSICMHIQY